jgi:hypothetical protein
MPGKECRDIEGHALLGRSEGTQGGHHGAPGGEV